ASPRSSRSCTRARRTPCGSAYTKQAAIRCPSSGTTARSWTTKNGTRPSRTTRFTVRGSTTMSTALSSRSSGTLFGERRGTTKAAELGQARLMAFARLSCAGVVA
ncbi:hypothetical protein AAVH_41285, partial [Aphelenchoides avenae]